MKKEMMNKIIEKLDKLARDHDQYEYGLPIMDDGQMALMREAIQEIVMEENVSIRDSFAVEFYPLAMEQIEKTDKSVLIRDTNLSGRAKNCLISKIDTVEELRLMDDVDIMRIRNIGIKTLEEIKLFKKGLNSEITISKGSLIAERCYEIADHMMKARG